MVANIPADDAEVRPTMTRFYGAFLVGAPTERAAFKAHVERSIAKVEKMDRETKEGAVLSLVVSSRVPTLFEDFTKTIDAYRVWQAP
jgi:hypothetical protein